MLRVSLTLLVLAVPLGAGAQSAPWAPPVTPPPTTPRGDEPVDYNTEAPGRFVLRLESAGAPQRVVVERRRPSLSTPEPDTRRAVLAGGTCVTPCQLYVDAGMLTLRAEGRGLRRTDTSFTMDASDALLRLRAPSQRQWNLGIGLVAGGGAVVLALLGFAVVSQARTDGVSLPTGAVVGVALAGGALLAGGIPLLVLNTGGIEALSPARAD